MSLEHTGNRHHLVRFTVSYTVYPAMKQWHSRVVSRASMTWKPSLKRCETVFLRACTSHFGLSACITKTEETLDDRAPHFEASSNLTSPVSAKVSKSLPRSTRWPEILTMQMFSPSRCMSDTESLSQSCFPHRFRIPSLSSIWVNRTRIADKIWWYLVCIAR